MTVDRIPITGLELNNLTLILDNGIETAGAINVVRVLIIQINSSVALLFDVGFQSGGAIDVVRVLVVELGNLGTVS